MFSTSGRVVCGPRTLEKKSKGGRKQRVREREREKKRETLKPDLSCPRLIENSSQAVLVCRCQQLFPEKHMDSNKVQVQQSNLGHVVLHGTQNGIKTHWGGFAKYIYLYSHHTHAHTFPSHPFQTIPQTINLLCETQTSLQTPPSLVPS